MSKLESRVKKAFPYSQGSKQLHSISVIKSGLLHNKSQFKHITIKKQIRVCTLTGKIEFKVVHLLSVTLQKDLSLGFENRGSAQPHFSIM